MICEIKTKTGSSGNCLGYDFGDKLEKDQVCRIVAHNGLFLSPTTIRTIEAVPETKDERKTHKKAVHDIANRLAASFDSLAAKGDGRMNTRFVEYIISFSPEDRMKLTPAVKEEIVLEYLAEMGVHGNGREAMFVATEHLGTNAPHIHVFTCRVDMQTRRATDINRDRIRNKKVCEDLTLRHGLAVATRDYKRDLSLTNEGYASRLRMRDLVRETAARTDGWKSFAAELSAQGMQVTVKRNADGSVRGVTFSVDGHTYSGAQLGRDCTYNNITGLFFQSWAARVIQQKPGQTRTAYIVHSTRDATLFHLTATEAAEVEQMRLALKAQGYCVDTMPLDRFREQFRLQSRDPFRVGYVALSQGKTEVVDCKVSGDPKLTKGFAPVPAPSAELTVRTTLATALSAFGVQADGYREQTAAAYAAALNEAAEATKKALHRRYDGVLRRAEVSDVFVSGFGEGRVSAYALVRTPGADRTEEVAVDIRPGEEPGFRTLNEGYYKGSHKEEIGHAMRNVLQLDIPYVVLERENAWSGRDRSTHLSTDAYLIATDRGRQYVLGAAFDHGRYTKDYYISEPVADGARIEDLRFFSASGETVSLEQAQQRAKATYSHAEGSRKAAAEDYARQLTRKVREAAEASRERPQQSRGRKLHR